MATIKVGDMFKCTHWTEPCILKTYKYKGYIIEHIEQTCHNQCSTYWHHEFRALKNGKIITKGHRRYSDCVFAIKTIYNYGNN